MGTSVSGYATLVLILFLTLGLEDRTEGCSCLPTHPQQHYCNSDVVIRAAILGKKISNHSIFEKMIQYEISVMKFYKGLDKVKDIQYVYTPYQDSLCGITLGTGGIYLLTGYIPRGGNVTINLCGLNVHWNRLPISVKSNLNNQYQMGCDCKITTCFSSPCAAVTQNECLWTGWQDSPGGMQSGINLAGVHANQACLKSSDGSCSWDHQGSTTPSSTTTPGCKL